jgi:plasmid stability protein
MMANWSRSASKKCALLHQLEDAMATTLTLINIPDELYGRLEAAAEIHRRSLNSEVLVCLESVLLPQRMPVEGRLARARELRQTLPTVTFTDDGIAQMRDEGRA